MIVVASTALTTTTLGFAAPAAPGPGPGASPAYTTSTIPVAGTSVDVAVDESTNTAYVTNPQSAPQGTVPLNGTVSVIDLTTKLVTRTVDVGINPTSIAVDPSTHRVYVANRGTSDIIGTPIGNNVSVIDPANNFATSTATVRGYPEAVAVDPNTHRVYVAHQAAELGTFDGVSVLDPNGSTFGDNTHAPSSVSAPVAVTAQPDPFQDFVGQFIRVARVILGTLVPEENLDFFF